ncbi:MAG: hypothetical protein NC293_12900 [Roseburia sp.]|nr:hypothetical protein [Roseburia sp.]
MKTTEIKKKDEAKLELYTLLGQGYKAMQEGRESSIEEVKERIKQRREQSVYH